MATDLLTTIRAEIEARLSQLRPALAEYEDLISAEQALGEGGEAAGDDDDTAETAGGGKAGAGGSRPRYSRPGRRTAARVAAKARSTAAEAKPAAASPRSPRKPRSDETERGILAALEHGSHTAAELVMVTAFTAQSVRRSLTRLERAGTIGRTRRDGQTAYVRA
ncbi:MAG TPA: winged helix-turn-helix domain-containing protein [Solirubrobacteraceae bacterium]|nr:winged helix-turn-helix domain-containing protein [Solirubrobacteraceae bacterium]